jgi:RNA polymerase sigma-70 factor, ECF subfamily
MEGDPVQAIGRLYERHAEAVRSYALRRSTPEMADEVTAQVFLVAWRRHSAVPADALPWLLGVARRVLADQRRAAARRNRLGERLQSTAVEEHAEVMTHDRGLAAALGRLSPGDREVVLLRVK